MDLRSRVHRGTWAQLAPALLHDLMKLRVDVFVVEQACPYPELDGRDLLASTEHWWTVDAAGPTAYLRTLRGPDDAARVGRVCTRADARGGGLAASLLGAVLANTDVAGRDVVLDAQEHLAAWYARHGFAVSGARYVEDGIPHVPMRRAARRT